MELSIWPSEIKGSVVAPASKSYTIRGLVNAALAAGTSELANPLVADDPNACLAVLAALGIDVEFLDNKWRVHGGGFGAHSGDLPCGESAATLRFMTAVSALFAGQHRLTAGPSLTKRPIQPLVEALRGWGVDCHCANGQPPVLVNGTPPCGGTTALVGNVSSQFVSALLWIAPLACLPIVIVVTTELESKPYVQMTLECMRTFGVTVEHAENLRTFYCQPQRYRPAHYVVEGDWSSASYLLALGAMAGEVTVGNLQETSWQADRRIVELLQAMGATVQCTATGITVVKSALRGICADLSDCPDLLPTMAVLAAVAAGTSEFTGIGRARLKESDRVTGMAQGLQRLGIRVAVAADANTMTITGGIPQAGCVDSLSDHRIAMAFGLLGTVAGPITIGHAECVTKTFPQFWQELARLGVVVKSC